VSLAFRIQSSRGALPVADFGVSELTAGLVYGESVVGQPVDFGDAQLRGRWVLPRDTMTRIPAGHGEKSSMPEAPGTRVHHYVASAVRTPDMRAASATDAAPHASTTEMICSSG
jgi:hypothetical protein